jgi:hypothetical protein
MIHGHYTPITDAQQRLLARLVSYAAIGSNRPVVFLADGVWRLWSLARPVAAWRVFWIGPSVRKPHVMCVSCGVFST